MKYDCGTGEHETDQNEGQVNHEKVAKNEGCIRLEMFLTLRDG